MRTLVRRKGDDGAVLLIALLVITVVALVGMALMRLGDGSLLAAINLRAVNSEGYSGDAAAQVAINDLEQGFGTDNATGAKNVTPLAPSTSWVFNNSGFDGCFGNDSALKPVGTIQLSGLGTTANPYSAAVTCAGVAGTGVYGALPGDPFSGNPNGFGGKADALRLVGSGGNDGLSLTTLNTTAFMVHGAVRSNSLISVSGGSGTNGLIATGDITCRTGTAPSPAISTSGTVTCPGGATVGVPSGFSPRINTIPSLASAPVSCVFSPGYYDDSVQLTKWTDACATSYFKSGAYYFDFHNNTQDVTFNADAMTGSATGASADVWAINNNLIGGEKSATYPTMPGACVSPLTTSTDGVQFLFGGDSHVSLGNNASVELCAKSQTGAPPIALYGEMSGNAPSASAPAPFTAADPVSSTTSDGSTAPTVTAAQINGTGGGATWTSSASGKKGATATWTLDLSGFDKAAPIPKGALLKSATLSVAHQESTTTSGAPTVSVAGNAVTGAAASTTLVTNQLTMSSTTNSDAWKALSLAAHSGALSSLHINVTSPALASGGSETFKSMQLTLTYYVPAMRGLGYTVISGQGTTDFGASNCLPLSCSFWTMGGGSSYKGSFHVQGATFVPNGSLALYLGNQSLGDAFRYGLVAWGLSAKMLNTYPSGVPVVSIPDNSGGLGATVVDLNVYVCPGSSPCPASGKVALTARLEIKDAATPAPGQRQMTILSWAAQR